MGFHLFDARLLHGLQPLLEAGHAVGQDLGAGALELEDLGDDGEQLRALLVPLLHQWSAPAHPAEDTSRQKEAGK